MKYVLHKALEVQPLTEEYQAVIIPNGEKAYLEQFVGQGVFDKTASVMVIWDFGGLGETIIESTKGSFDSRNKLEIGTGDGVKKVALVLNNADSTNTAIMSGTAVIKTE